GRRLTGSAHPLPLGRRRQRP
ncbi:MAG: hypothetical protein AVDCRST_MAG19-4110, partial [uncultured Thermomicrobiales bacterium]